MEHIQERRNGIAGCLSNLCLLNQSVVEDGGCALFLLSHVAASVLTLGLLSRRHTRDVEAHLDELVLASTGLLALPTCAAQVTIRAGVVDVVWQRHLDGDLIPASQVGVANLRVGQLEGGPVLDAEGELRLGELGLAPVPAAQGVLLVIQHGAVPVLEDLGEALVVLLLEAVKLDDARVALQDADLVALGRATPLRAANVAVVESEGVAAARGLPAESVLGEATFAALLGEVEEDVVEALAGRGRS